MAIDRLASRKSKKDSGEPTLEMAAIALCPWIRKFSGYMSALSSSVIPGKTENFICE